MLAVALMVGLFVFCNQLVFSRRLPSFTVVQSRQESFIDLDDDGKSNTIHATDWKSEPWEPVDSRRIFMHVTNDKNNLNARQICTLESVAKNNPNRPVQLFMKRQDQFGQSAKIQRGKSPLHFILRRYSNLDLIYFDENDYFTNTSLKQWYLNSQWRSSPHRDAHLSNYISALSILRGGGLFIDLNSIFVINSLSGSQWWNFFVRNNQPSSFKLNSQIMHRAYGHSLSDAIVLNLARFNYNPSARAEEPVTAATDASIEHLCRNWMDNLGQCLDIQFLDHQAVYLPSFNSYFWNPILLAFNQTSGFSDEEIRSIIHKEIESHGATLVAWDSMASLQQQNDQPLLKKVYSILLAEHCPITLLHFSQI